MSFETGELLTTASAEGDDCPKARHAQAQREYRAREKAKAEIREGIFLRLAQKHSDDLLEFADEVAEARGMDFSEVMDLLLFRHGD